MVGGSTVASAIVQSFENLANALPGAGLQAVWEGAEATRVSQEMGNAECSL